MRRTIRWRCGNGVPLPRRCRRSRGTVAVGRRRGDAVGGFPTDRGWTPTAERHPQRRRILEDAGGFDAEFFGMLPARGAGDRSAAAVAAGDVMGGRSKRGDRPRSVAGSPTGVSSAPPLRLRRKSSAGRPTTPQARAHRQRPRCRIRPVAYTLGLEGPAVTVDTAARRRWWRCIWRVRPWRVGSALSPLVGGGR